MPKLPALQSLRAIAALLVVFDHAADLTAGHGLPAEPLHSFALFAGAQGVALFFLLSGFIMVYTSSSSTPEPSPLARARRFASRRILRIVPLYWLLTTLIAVPTLFLSLSRPVHITLSDDLRSLFFIPYADFAGHMTPVLPVGWTLNYEMAFYAIFTAILLLPRHSRTIVLLGTLTLIVLLGARHFPLYAANNPHTPMQFLTHPIILLFGFGAALGTLKLLYPAVALPIPAVPSVILLLVLNGAIFLHTSHQPTLPQLSMYWTIDLVAVAICSFGFRTHLQQLEQKIEAIGDSSYSLYLVHLLPVLLIWIIYQRLQTPHPIAFILVAMVSALAAGRLCYRYVEQPLTKSLSARFHTPRKPAPATVEFPEAELI